MQKLESKVERAVHHVCKTGEIDIQMDSAEGAKNCLAACSEQDKMDFPLSVLEDYELWDPAKKGRFKTWCKNKKNQAPDFYYKHIVEKAAGHVAV